MYIFIDQQGLELCRVRPSAGHGFCSAACDVAVCPSSEHHMIHPPYIVMGSFCGLSFHALFGFQLMERYFWLPGECLVVHFFGHLHIYFKISKVYLCTNSIIIMLLLQISSFLWRMANSFLWRMARLLAGDSESSAL